MNIRNAILTEHQAALEDDLVDGRPHQNASAGLLLIEKREFEDSLRLKALQAAVQVALADSAAGRFTDFNSSQSLTKHLKSLVMKEFPA